MQVIKEKIKLTKIALFLMDIFIIIIAYILMEIFFFNFSLDMIFTNKLFNSILFAIIIYQLFLNLFEVYRNITVFESAKEYFSYALVCMVSCNVISLLQLIFNLDVVSPKENLLAGILVAIMLIFYRVVIRFFLTNTITIKPEGTKKNLLIIGAGEAGTEVIKNIKNNLTTSYNIIGLIDDDVKKDKCKINGVKILGNRNDIVKICKEKNIDIIFFTISNISMQERKKILAICQETGVKLRILPGLQDIITEKNILQNMRDVEIEDILGRDPIVLDNDNIESLIKNNVILITGAGGSIGSELCRQIAKFNPKELILIDI